MGLNIVDRNYFHLTFTNGCYFWHAFTFFTFFKYFWTFFTSMLMITL